MCFGDNRVFTGFIERVRLREGRAEDVHLLCPQPCSSHIAVRPWLISRAEGLVISVLLAFGGSLISGH